MLVRSIIDEIKTKTSPLYVFHYLLFPIIPAFTVFVLGLERVELTVAVRANHP